MHLSAALDLLHRRWQDGIYLVGDSLSMVAIISATLNEFFSFDSVNTALDYPWLFSRITQIYGVCPETLPRLILKSTRRAIGNT